VQAHTFSVPEISCSHCKMTIEGAVNSLAGIELVAVDIPARTVDVAFDETAVALDEIVAAIEESGYEVAT
jgi:copper chaperone